MSSAAYLRPEGMKWKLSWPWGLAMYSARERPMLAEERDYSMTLGICKLTASLDLHDEGTVHSAEKFV